MGQGRSKAEKRGADEELGQVMKRLRSAVLKEDADFLSAERFQQLFAVGLSTIDIYPAKT